MASRTEDLTVVHDGLLPGEDAQQFAATCLAEITHLPTGMVSERGETVTVPGGMEMPDTLGASGALVLHVLAGRAMFLWSGESARSAAAGPGDTVLVPAGVAFRALNVSAEQPLQLFRMRGT